MKRTLTLIALLLLALAPSARALTNEENPASVQLVAAQIAHDGTPILAGLVFRLEPGWKTYWRNPGDSGIAPTFDWGRSENIRSIELRWPAPKRFHIADETIFGYQNEVVLPLLVRALDPAKPVQLRLKLEYAVCSTLCVPLKAELALIMPAGKPEPSQDAALIRHYLSLVPVDDAIEVKRHLP